MLRAATQKSLPCRAQVTGFRCETHWLPAWISLASDAQYRDFRHVAQYDERLRHVVPFCRESGFRATVEREPPYAAL